MGVTAERGKQARETYYDAVFQELAARGYRGLTVEGIVRRAGGSRGRFYHHFENKHDALVQSYRAHTEASIKNVEDSLNAGASIERAITDNLLKLARGEPSTLALATLEMHLLAARDLDIRKIIASDYHAKLSFHAQLFRRGMETGELRADIDPDECARQLYSSVCGVCLVHFGTGRQDSLERPLSAAMHLVFDAMRAPPSAG